ncbi:MAG TPA: hypothetical protein VFE85_09615 [Woeseiaceae bacterium]|nr:hypothetical protein [Woeseiaceae bacterium]
MTSPDRLFLAIAACGVLLALPGTMARASGGLVLQNDVCELTIGFYKTHFTAYQPNARGNQEFCEHLPAAGKTIFVLDYLHRSLKEVPVDFRVIHDVTGKGRFVRPEDVEALGDLGPYTVVYQEPVIKSNGTLTVEHTFAEEGHYIGIVTAGHPSNDNTYTAVFPLALGVQRVPWAWIAFGGAILLAGGFLFAMKRIGRRRVGQAA